jgi:hypothetical protein
MHALADMKTVRYFEFRVDDMPSGAFNQPADLRVGLTMPDQSAERVLGITKHSYALRLHDGKAIENNTVVAAPVLAAPVQKGDVIGLGVDFRWKHVFVTHNGIYCGTAWRGLPVYRQFFVAASFTAAQQSLTFMPTAGMRYAPAASSATSRMQCAFAAGAAGAAVQVQSTLSKGVFLLLPGLSPLFSFS